MSPLRRLGFWQTVTYQTKETQGVIAAFSCGEDGCSTRHRFLRLGGQFISRVRPSWGG